MSAWIAGPPPGRGWWWVVWRQQTATRVIHHVEPVEVGPAFIHRDNPDARLLVKTLGGIAYEFEANRDDMIHHMPIEQPEAP